MAESSIVFIASTHGFLNDFTKQREIINRVNPEYVLLEDIHDLVLDKKEKYEKIFKNKRISDLTSFDDVSELLRFCFAKNIKLIGIDLPDFGYSKTLKRKIMHQENLSTEEETEMNRIISLRQKNHLMKILEYRKKTDKPLVVILGSWHLQENSLLRTRLKNYKLIYPCDKDKKILIEPPKDIKIGYCEVVVNGN